MGKLFSQLVFVIFLSIFSVMAGTAQNSWFHGIESAGQSGFIMPHNRSIDYMTSEYVNAFHLNLVRETDGDKLWEKLYGYPSLGFGFYHGSLGNNHVYGKSYSLYSYFEAPAFRYPDLFEINYRLSYGLSYVTKTFELYRNYNNIAIGTHLNLHFNLMLNLIIPFNNHFKLFSSAGFTHFSNGKIKSPNKGLNVVSGGLGIRYMFSPAEKEAFDPESIPPVKKKNHYTIIWSNGIKDYSRFDQNKYYIYSLAFNYHRKYKHWGQWGTGLDLFYDGSLINLTETRSGGGFFNKNLYRLGLHGSQEFLIGDFSLGLQLGYYLYSKVFYITNIYSRVSLKYKITPFLLANISLKSHNANAEFIEFGVGYSW